MSQWQWRAELGDIVGLSRHEGDILVYMLRRGTDKFGAQKVWIACERFVLDTSLSPRPYMDSLRPTLGVLTPTADAFINPSSGALSAITYLAFGTDQGDKQFLGTDMTRVEEFIEQYPTAPATTWTGIDFPAYVTPTNPYIRDRDGNAIVVGRLTVGRLAVSMSDSGGLTLDVETPNGTTRAQDFSGRLLGRATNRVGRQPIVSTTVTAPVGKEGRDFKYTVAAKTFLPLTITAIEWVGQYFNNARRV